MDSYFFILIITICSQDAEISVLQIGFPTFPCQAAGAWQRALDALDQALYLHRCIDIYIVYPIFMSQRCLTLNKDDKPISIFFWGVKANPSSNLETPTLTEVKHFSIAMVDYKRVDDPEIILALGCRLPFLG